MSFYDVKIAVEDAVWDFVKDVSQYNDDNITFGKTNKIRPEDPYITIRFLNAERYARGRREGYTPTCEEETAADYKLQFEIAAFRDDPANSIDPFATLWQITHAFGQPSHTKILNDAHVGFSDSTNVIDTSGVRDGATWEQSGSFFLTLNVGVLEVGRVPIDIIETVNMEATLLDTDESVIAQENISVTTP